jgi:hypothetical protein
MRTADLIWVRYTKQGQTQNFLLLYLFNNGQDITGLIADKIPNVEIHKLRSHLKEIQGMTADEINTWVKHHMPVAYKQAYFKKPSDRFDILKTYNIKDIKV